MQDKIERCKQSAAYLKHVRILNSALTWQCTLLWHHLESYEYTKMADFLRMKSCFL